MGRAFHGVFILFLLAGCGTNGGTLLESGNETIPSKKDTIPIEQIAGNFSDQQTIKVDSTKLPSFLERFSHFKSFNKEFYRFYRSRGFSYVWHDKKGLVEQAHNIYARILHMEDQGLTLDIPYQKEYERLMGYLEADSNLVREFLITGEYLHFAKKFLVGIPEEDSRSLQWFIPRKKADYTVLADKMISENTVDGQWFYPLYGKLRLALKKYRSIEKEGGWDEIHYQGSRPLKMGDTLDIIPILRKRLEAEGFMSGNKHSKIYDNPMAIAVKQFQKSHGYQQDGIIERKLIKAMNITVKERIEQIMVNMERCRWLPNETTKPYLVVNIPEFKAYVYEGDSIVYSSKVVVGKETHRTVIFKGEMKYVVFSPYWNIPESILQKEILPALKRNSNYLIINDMQWFNGKLRQMPGEKNALGRVKFLFPNAFNIYLHDTPSRKLFEQEKRTFSHGCIRLSSPRELAVYLLKDRPEWTSEAIDKAMYEEKEQYVTLKNSLPVYIVYFTAFVDADGVLQFRDDVYDRDRALLDMMFKK